MDFFQKKNRGEMGERKEGGICLVNQICGGGLWGSGVVLGCVERGVFF